MWLSKWHSVGRPNVCQNATVSVQRWFVSVTMTTEVGTDSATTLSRMNLSGYVGHVTIFS